MRMKQFIILILSMMFCLSGWAEGVKIPLYKTKHGGQNTNHPQEERTLFHEPVATYDGTQICIYSEKDLENALIRVTDSLGNVLFEQELNSLIGQYIFQLPASGNECLTLTIITSTEQYEGEFFLT